MSDGNNIRPRPVETERDDGSILVEKSSHISDASATVAPEDRPLYELLMDVLEGAHAPDLMPADLATHCEHLYDVRETVTSYERGSIILGDGGPSYGMGYCHGVRDAIDEHRDRPPVRLVAVGCSGSKHDVDGAVPAADLYKGSYWTNKQDYGSAIGDQWRIISAEHALLEPDAEIEHYETTPDDLEDVPVDSEEILPSGDPVTTLLDEWALRVHEALQEWINTAAGAASVDPRDVELEVLLGRRYHDPLQKRYVFSALGSPAELTVSHPFREHDFGGNGDQMAWMGDQVDQAVATDGGDSA
jgi:hypothetical protein